MWIFISSIDICFNFSTYLANKDLMKLDGVPEDVDVYDLLKQLKQEDEEQETKEQEAEVIDPEAGENIIEENTIEKVVESDTADDIELMLKNKEFYDIFTKQILVDEKYPKCGKSEREFTNKFYNFSRRYGFPL